LHGYPPKQPPKEHGYPPKQPPNEHPVQPNPHAPPIPMPDMLPVQPPIDPVHWHGMPTKFGGFTGGASFGGGYRNTTNPV
jgi:hypothetical protein